MEPKALAEHVTTNGEHCRESDKDVRQLHGWKWAIAYTAMLSTTFLFSLDNTIVADIQPAILEEFGHVELLPWIGTGFALGTIAVLPWGKIYGIFNIKGVYLFNIILFEVGSAICGAAPNMTSLIIGRVIAGVGGSGMYSGTLTYVSVSTTTKEKPAYLAGSTVIWGLGSVLGPVVGGAFAISKATWRWGFYINLVIGAVFAPFYLLLLPSIDPQRGKTFAEKCAMIDWPTTVSFFAGSCCLTLGISLGGLVYNYNSAAEIALWVVTCACLIATVLLLRFHPTVAKTDRLYPVHFFKRPILINMQAQVFLSSAIILAMTYYIPLYFQFVRGDGPLDAGVRLLPLIVFMVVASMVNGVFMSKLSVIWPWYVGGSAIVLIGSALMYTVKPDTANANVYGYMILVGTGAGCYIVAGFSIVQSLVPATDIANAVGAMAIAQDLGMVLFLALCGSVFQNIAIQKIQTVLPGALPTEISQLVAGTSSSAFQALNDTDRALVIPQITDALKNIWLLFTAAAALSFLLSLPLVKIKLG